MIEFLKGHPCTYTKEELSQMDEKAKELFLEGPETVSDEEATEEKSTETPQLIVTAESLFDLSSVVESFSNTRILIEAVRNLQQNIIYELYKSRINLDYISECNFEIDRIIVELIELNDKKS